MDFLQFQPIRKKSFFAIYVLTNHKVEDDRPILVVQLEDRTKRRILGREKRGHKNTNKALSNKAGDELTTSAVATRNYYGTKSSENQQVGRQNQASPLQANSEVRVAELYLYHQRASPKRLHFTYQSIASE